MVVLVATIIGSCCGVCTGNKQSVMQCVLENALKYTLMCLARPQPKVLVFNHMYIPAGVVASSLGSSVATIARSADKMLNSNYKQYTKYVESKEFLESWTE